MFEEIKLSAEQEKQIANWEKSYGEKSALGRRQFLTATEYVQQRLTCEFISHSRPYNCYNEGQNRYTRQDSAPLTEEDIQAILRSGRGQGSKIVKGKVGDTSVVHEWFIDSSD